MFVSQDIDSKLKLRDPATVMRLARLGSFHQCRLSFMRNITRRMARENWRFERPVFDIDATGVGHALYTAIGPDRTYTLVAFAHDLPPDKRSDRVIADAWDATFTLFDGVPTVADIDRLRQNVPLQEAGRVTGSELSLSRANRSVRLWKHVVERLANGQQPDTELINSVGYLMRTTAVYGSGKFGAADRESVADRPEFFAPFQVEMLSVFLTRAFVRDLVQHMANALNPDAVTLDPKIARSIGIGNSTGLGMAPFLLNHPQLINNWIAARETAIARVRGVKQASAAQVATFGDIFQRSLTSVALWHSQHPLQITKLTDLRADLDRLSSHLTATDLRADHAWDALVSWGAKNLSHEGQECLNSLILEPYGALVDDLTSKMSAFDADEFPVRGHMNIGDLRALIEQNYAWALEINWDMSQANARAWYVSEEKLEPRIGERFEEPIADYEQPLSPARDVARLYVATDKISQDQQVAEFLLHHPQHRHILRRVQITAHAPFGEIHDNTIAHDMLPIDLLRCKLSFFGAIHFDPRSDRWVRICMYSGAPYPEELGSFDADTWIYPRAEARQ